MLKISLLFKIFVQTYGQIIREFLISRMPDFQGIVFI